MSDDTTTATETADETTATEAPAQETDWKAEARKWEARAKENSTAAKRLSEIEEASKTEAQKLAERAEKAEQALAAAQSEALRNSVLAKHSIPEDYHDFVVGSTEDELTAKAQRVQKLIEAQSAAPVRHEPVHNEGRSMPLALNGDGIETALRDALGIH